MYRSGTAELPLHYGSAPRWLFQRMVKLATCITEIIVLDLGQREFILRLSDPYWFQALACVLGFDWHSSGTTTTTCGALKEALKNLDIGIKAAGGKGTVSRNTPSELRQFGEKLALSDRKISALVYASRLSAKVDNVCVQDGYQLYHHCIFFTEHGSWAVIQQGLNDATGYARRYHWCSENVTSFVEEPHSAICCDRREKAVLDMTASASAEARKISVELVNDGIAQLKRYFYGPQLQLSDFLSEPKKILKLPKHHNLLAADIGPKGFAILQKAYELQPQNYEELIAIEGIGPQKVRALALISAVIYGASPSWKDPAKYSFAHGGKDGYPYPVDRKTYDSSIQILKNAIEDAKVASKDKLSALRRLGDWINRNFV